MKNRKNKYILIPKDLQKNLINFLEENFDIKEEWNEVSNS